MKGITAEQIAKAVGGVLMNGFCSAQVTSVAIDSRKAGKGSLFVAIKGEKNDGHDFVQKAVEQGSTAVLVSSKRDEAFAAALEAGTAVIRVANTEKALQDLAGWYLSQFSPLPIGVTGSTGKTGTKEMLRAIFSERYKTVCTQGNQNNMIGLPLSIFQVEEDTEILILEMGMDCFGEIHRYVELVRPCIGIITNIGLSHVERLGSRENILKAKMEITDYFGEKNVLIINRDNDLLGAWKPRGTYRVITTGCSEDLRGPEDIQITEIRDLGQEGIEFTLSFGDLKEPKKPVETRAFRLHLPGKHNAFNAALAVAAGRQCGITPEEAASGLEKLRETVNRLNVEDTGSVQIINDTYNASPDSMRAGLDVLSSLKCTRKAAILGDMFELGPDEQEYHRRVGEYAAKAGVSLLLSVGNNARFYSEGAKVAVPETETYHYNDKEELKKELKGLIREGDAVLVKGSRGMAMEEIAELLKEDRTK